MKILNGIDTFYNENTNFLLSLQKHINNSKKMYIIQESERIKIMNMINKIIHNMKKKYNKIINNDNLDKYIDTTLKIPFKKIFMNIMMLCYDYGINNIKIFFRYIIGKKHYSDLKNVNNIIKIYEKIFVPIQITSEPSNENNDIEIYYENNLPSCMIHNTIKIVIPVPII